MHGELNIYKAVGCPECGGTGYRGRVPLFEVLTMTDEIALLVGAPTREIEAMAISQGMFTLREDGVRLAVGRHHDARRGTPRRRRRRQLTSRDGQLRVRAD